MRYDTRYNTMRYKGLRTSARLSAFMQISSSQIGSSVRGTTLLRFDCAPTLKATYGSDLRGRRSGSELNNTIQFLLRVDCAPTLKATYRF